MHVTSFVIALLGFGSLGTAAPSGPFAPRVFSPQAFCDNSPAVALLRPIQQTTITVIQDNLDVVDDLAELAERQFGALVQSQLALAWQLETVKNNIRANHFRSRFGQVNTVIVTVTSVVDASSNDVQSNRFLVNQLLVDNGFPNRQIVVMVSDIETLTVRPTGTNPFFGSSPTGFPQPLLGAFDPEAPFGNYNQSVILPRGAFAPTLDLVFPDPAAIILPRHASFVETPQGFLQSCASFAANGNSFVNRAGHFFNNFGQVAAAQLAGLRGLRALSLLAGGAGSSTDTAAAADATSE